MKNKTQRRKAKELNLGKHAKKWYDLGYEHGTWKKGGKMKAQTLVDCGYLIINIQEYIESGNKEKAQAHLRVLNHVLLTLAKRVEGEESAKKAT